MLPRLLYQELDSYNSIRDFVRCAHLESLHNHDAVVESVKGYEMGLGDSRSVV